MVFILLDDRMNVIIPSMLITFAHLATFTLPLGEIEKVNISFTCLLAYSVFQLMVVGDMPRSSDHIPLLSIYIDLQMAYIALSLVNNTFHFLIVPFYNNNAKINSLAKAAVFLPCIKLNNITMASTTAPFPMSHRGSCRSVDSWPM